MKTIITYRKIWNIAYPIILGSIIQNVISVTDTAFLGHVGEIELGGAAIGGVFYLTFIMIGLGFSIGTQIIVARRYGEDNNHDIGKYIMHSHYFLLFLALLFVFLIRLNLSRILGLSVESQNIFDASSKYLSVRVYGILFAFINFGFRAFYIGVARTRVITWTTIFMAIINVFLDYALIFGKFGFKEMDIAGAALASVIAEFSATLFFILYTMLKIEYRQYGLFRFTKINFKLLSSIIKVSFPTMLQNFVAFTGWFFFFIFVEKMGEHDLAISNIVRSIYVIMLIPIMGFSSATNSLVSYIIGKGRENEVFALVVKILKFCIFSVFFIVVIMLFIPEQIISIYTNNASLIQDAIPVYYVICIGAFAISAGFVTYNGVAGTGNTLVSLLIESYTIIIYIAITYLLSNVFLLPIQFVWSVEILYGLIIAVSSILYLKLGKWTVGNI